MRMPQACAIRASRGAFRFFSSQPVRIFRVTGRSTDRTVASRIRAAWSSSRISAEPAWPLTTFLTGHPKLMSMICAPRSALSLAASAMTCGSQPASCTAIGCSSSQLFVIVIVLRRFANHCLARDHFRDDKAGAKALDQAAKRQVADPRHRCQDYRIVNCHRAELNAHFLSILSYCLTIKQIVTVSILQCNNNRRSRRPAGAVATE